MNFVKVNNLPAGRTFDGLLNDLFSNFENLPGRDLGNNQPKVNITETADGYELDFAAPGRSKENFKLKVEDKQLTVSYEAVKTEAAADTKHIRKEFSVTDFKRSFTLDEKTNAEGISAKYENGILKLFVPKKEATKPAVTEITVG
ncbi:MAG: Hsp20/alpha crystallin family protein [Chitinophagaceae bacterium]